MALINLLLAWFLASLSHAGDYKYYVSSSGSDNTGNGSNSNPWATIQKAQSSVQALIATLSPNTYIGNITINIEAGIYYGPLQYTVKDSMINFQNNNYVIYKGDINGNVYIYGGRKVSSTWMNISKYSNTTYTFYRTNLKNQINDIPNNKIYSLFFNNIRMQLSKSSLYTYSSYDIKNRIINTNNKMIPDIQNILQSNYSNNLMAILYEYWTSSYHLVTSIHYDSSTGDIKIYLKEGPTNFIGGAASGNRFYLINNGEFDGFHANSFYYNITTNDLDIRINSSWNPNDKNNNILFAKDIEIINIMGDTTNKQRIDRLQFENLNVKYSAVDFSGCLSGSCTAQSAAMLSSSTIQTTYASNICFKNVNVSLTGGYAVWINEGSVNCSYVDSYINNVGAGGIRIGYNGGGVVGSDMLSSNILISNNYILNGGFVFEAGCGILAQSTEYTLISNNEIAHFKYTGISTGWTWGYSTTSVNNIILSHNEIYDIGQWTLSDMGCIYTLGTQINSKVINNICHDVYSYNYGGWGTYTDEGSRFITFQDNIVYNTKCAGHHQHYGLDNIFLNNIYYFNDLYNMDGAFLSDHAGGTCSISSNPEACSSLTFITNIIYVNNTYNKDILDDPPKDKYKNFTFDGNTYWSNQQKTKITFPDSASIQQWQNQGKDVQVAIADPMFVDPTKYNFDLQPGSPSLALGFHSIDTSNVGPNW